MCGWQVGFLPVPEHLGDVVIDFEIRGFAGVRGPHPEERQCHRVEDRRYVVSSNAFLTGSNDSFSVVVSKDLQERDWIGDGAEEGI